MQQYNLGKIKLTASKMSRAALATVDSGKRVPREGRVDAGALVGVLVGVLFGGALVGATRVGFGGVGHAVASARAGFARPGVGVARVGVAGKSTGSCKSGKGESRDDFELHIVFCCCCSTEHVVKRMFW